eukprot:CAMPEP_0170504782 /NCGR_PEP_ID=MMETSP0208-20121228/48933_1 /TAXON_ID=197538 /ORGANISM="Strombidium inclinatum, Strain S3" /LENGTH=116 /DNA_ID=CAMNT_0010785225 /DNA_START=323 /DNA_END=670 /DNA_ORIENTATION=-
MTLYWVVIHKFIMNHFAEQPLHQWQQILVHSLPGLACLINSCLTNAVLDPRILLQLQTVGDAYLISNLITFLLTGEILYAFLDWRKWHCVVVVISMHVVFSGIYVVFTKLDIYFKR